MKYSINKIGRYLLPTGYYMHTNYSMIFPILKTKCNCHCDFYT